MMSITKDTFRKTNRNGIAKQKGEATFKINLKITGLIKY